MSLSGLRFNKKTMPHSPTKEFEVSSKGKFSSQFNFAWHEQKETEEPDFKTTVKQLEDDEVSTTDFKLYNRAAGFRFRKSQI